MTNLVKVVILVAVAAILITLALLGYKNRGAIRAIYSKFFGEEKRAAYLCKRTLDRGVVFEKPVEGGRI